MPPNVRRTAIPLIALLYAALLLSTARADSSPDEKIDRHALVTRHNIAWNDVAGQIPVGNGKFCFNADATGLETFGGLTMAHWAWHSFPLPAGWTWEMVPPTGTFQKGKNTRAGDVYPKSEESIHQWLRADPHMFNLGRLSLCGSNGLELSATEITDISRTFDLWSGIQTSTYKVNGTPVTVKTAADPKLDAVSISITSSLVANGQLQVALDFPYPERVNNKWNSNYSLPDKHVTRIYDQTATRAHLDRNLDGTNYFTTLHWSDGGNFALSTTSPHRFLLRSPGHQQLSLVCGFSQSFLDMGPNTVSRPQDTLNWESLPDAAPVLAASSAHWENFWMTGGAIDLSGSKDPRWFELERRIVLSQYLTAVNSAGSYPPAESGLMAIDRWGSQFHMEMVWWHLAHFALWNRWALGEQALGCYDRFTPIAGKLAAQLDYKGIEWPKAVGPEGRTMPWLGAEVLLWKEPHPIFFAELDYRLHPTKATLDKWKNIVAGTATYMADYPVRDARTGIYHLDPVMPPSERGITRDTVFDLAYWRYGLEIAQEWRQRMGLPREPHWDDVLAHLAPLPTHDGLYVHSAEWMDTYTNRAWEHPDPIGPLGMLPPMPGVIDPATAQRTVLAVWKTWNWDRCMGWDFPWMAMAAARTGEPGLAVEALLRGSIENHFDERGGNTGYANPYLPANGGLLYATAMMAAGWDGAPKRNAPGFPDNGQWHVRWENLNPAP
jgi:hypothetical protein